MGGGVKIEGGRVGGDIEEEEPEDMLLSRFAEETDLLDWYFIWFLRLDSFCFYQYVYSLNYGLFL